MTSREKMSDTPEYQVLRRKIESGRTMADRLCWICGQKSTKTLKNVPYCADCYRYASLQEKALEAQRQDLRVRTMYSKALEWLFKSNFSISDYRRESEWVFKTALDHPTMFASMPEMLTAIVLTAHKIPLKCQVTVAGFKTDFCITQHKIILEIDGERHDGEYDYFRDQYMYKCLPNGWVIARLKDTFAMKSPQKIIGEIEKQVSKSRAGFRFTAADMEE